MEPSPDLADNLSLQLRSILDYVAARDATLIYSATAGIGRDNTMMMKILCNRTKHQISAIDLHFRALSQNKECESLTHCIARETSGNYGKFMENLTESRGRFLMNKLCEAMDGVGCDKAMVNEIFCLSSAADIFAMKELYEASKDSSLSDKIRSELGGEHEKVILHLLHHGRPEAPVDPEAALEQAHRVKSIIDNGKAFVGGLKNEAEEELSLFLASLPAEQCFAMRAAWATLFPSKDSLERTLKNKLSGALEEACVMLTKRPRDIFCEKLRDAMKGLGCDEDVLCRVIGGNHKHTAVLIAQLFQEKYDKDLRRVIASETGGKFERALLTWLKGADPLGGMEPTLQYYTAQYEQKKAEAEGGEVDAAWLGVYCNLLQLAIKNAKEFVMSLDVDLLLLAARNGILGTSIGADERAIVGILCTKTKDQLELLDVEMRRRGLSKYSCLRKYIDKETGGDLREMLTYTQMSEAQFDAHILRKAFTGIGCDKRAVVEVVCTRDAQRLQNARKLYQARYDEDLYDRIREEMSSGLARLCVRMFRGSRGRGATVWVGEGVEEDEGGAGGGGEEEFSAESVAEQLYAGGAGQWGANSEAFVDILTSHTLAEMQQVCEAYDREYSASLLSAIQSEFSGAFEMALVSLIQDPIDLFCRSLKEAMEGIGATESVISRVLGGNDKAVVQRIAQRYFEKYDISLLQALSQELYYDFRKACMTYVASADLMTQGAEDRLKELVLEAHDPPPPPPRVRERTDPPPSPPSPPSRPPPPPEEEEEADADDEEMELDGHSGGTSGGGQDLVQGPTYIIIGVYPMEELIVKMEEKPQPPPVVIDAEEEEEEEEKEEVQEEDEKEEVQEEVVEEEVQEEVVEEEVQEEVVEEEVLEEVVEGQEPPQEADISEEGEEDEEEEEPQEEEVEEEEEEEEGGAEEVEEIDGEEEEERQHRIEERRAQLEARREERRAERLAQREARRQERQAAREAAREERRAARKAARQEERRAARRAARQAVAEEG